MAKKSKTQRAKASANRAAKKERAKQAEVTPVVEEESKKRFGFGEEFFLYQGCCKGNLFAEISRRRLTRSPRKSALLSFPRFVPRCVA